MIKNLNLYSLKNSVIFNKFKIGNSPIFKTRYNEDPSETNSRISLKIIYL